VVEAQFGEVHVCNSLPRGFVDDVRCRAIEDNLVATRIELRGGYESRSNVCAVENILNCAFLHRVTYVEKERDVAHSCGKQGLVADTYSCLRVTGSK